MRAYWYREKGAAAEVLRSDPMPTPEPGNDEVRVRVTHSAVNPTDSKRRILGRELGTFSRIIPNNDGAGVIDKVGAGVSEARIGERVWVFGAQAGRPFGTAAEYVVLPARQAIRLPDGTLLSEGACLGVPAVTAHRALFADGSIAGQTILVTGAAGRVGSYAVQLAKWAGARVIGTAGSEEKVDAVRGLGADLAVSYRGGNVVDAVMDFTNGTGVDRIVDTAFSETVESAPELVRPNGVIASYSSDANPSPQIPFQRLMYKNIMIRPFAIFGMPYEAKERAFSDVTAALAANAVTHRIGKRLDFAQMVEAHSIMDGETVWGCLVVDVASE